MATKPNQTKNEPKMTAPAVTPEQALAAATVVGAQNADGSATEASPGTVAANPLQSEALAAAAVPHKPAAFVPKLAKILTLPLLKMKEGEPIYVKFTGPIFTGKMIKDDLAQIEKNKALVAAGKSPEAVKAPPEMANVINLPTGELVQIMLGSVLKGIMTDEYPNDSYVGKGFVIELTEKKRGRSGGNYNTYKVAELDLS